MFFTEDKYDRGFEQVMKAVPNFYPRGSGIIVTGKFKYTAEICDCRYCAHFSPRKGCMLDDCVCLDERVAVGVASVKEIMKATMSEIKHNGFNRRLRRYIKESEATRERQPQGSVCRKEGHTTGNHGKISLRTRL